MQHDNTRLSIAAPDAQVGLIAIIEVDGHILAAAAAAPATSGRAAHATSVRRPARGPPQSPIRRVRIVVYAAWMQGGCVSRRVTRRCVAGASSHGV